MMSIHDAIVALQQLCADVRMQRVSVEFCPCEECQVCPRHVITINQAGRTVTPISIVNRNFADYLRVVNPSNGQALEFPLIVLRAFGTDSAASIKS